MGREVERIALARGHQIIARIDPEAKEADAATLTPPLAQLAEIVIEFALPHGIEKRVECYAQNKLKAVIATTGWLDKKGLIAEIVERYGAGLVYGSNFSVGANLFFAIVKQAARLVAQFPTYDVLGYELHHRLKKDSPSGTALTLAEAILKEYPAKDKIVTDKLDRAIAPTELHFASVRGGYIPGTHTLLFDSDADTIELTHRARSRQGFALGSLIAAEWISNQTGFFEFSEIFQEHFCKEKEPGHV